MSRIPRFALKSAVRNLLLGRTPPVASLEWGSHRDEHQLKDYIRYEREFGQAESLSIADPVTARVRTHSISAPVLYLLDSVVFKPSSGILYANRLPIKESIPWNFSVPLFPGPKETGMERRDGATATAINLQRNHYHFLLEDLPRLIFLKREAGLTRVYTAASQISHFALEALSRLNIEVVPVAKNLFFRRLLFVGLLGLSGVPSTYGIDLVRTALQSPVPQGKRRTYVSRQASKRQFFDESAVEKHLQSRGFDIVYTEKMSLDEQIATLATSTITVGPHGAGLANSIFMPKASRLIEIMSSTWANPLYEITSKGRLRYSRVLLRPED